MNFIKDKTVGLRHRIVKIVAPKIYKEYVRRINDEISIRPMIEFIRKEKGKEKLIGIEIGVAEGYNALSILQNLNMERLYLIDPYEKYNEDGFKLDNSNTENKMRKRLSSYNDIIKIIKKLSDDAKYDVKDMVDFVYIDGNHEFNYVWNDIINYWKLVKYGGVIGGHDFNSSYLGVIKAVLFFANDYFKLCGKDSDWWICK